MILLYYNDNGTVTLLTPDSSDGVEHQDMVSGKKILVWGLQ